MRKTSFFILILGISFYALSAHAADLLQVYQKASKSDPVFKEAYAKQMSVAESVPTARAVLLPQLSATGSTGFSKITTNDSYKTNGYSSATKRTEGYTLNLKQSIFNFANWKKLTSANDTLKSAQADYNAAALSLISRTTTAYFNILEAQDILAATLAKKKAYYEQYVQANERFKVGLSTMTDVYDAKAYYDKSIAEEVKAQNDLANKKEDLRSITGDSCDALAAPQKTFPFVSPNPDNMDQWVTTAMAQNWGLKSSQYSAASAHATIDAAKGGHLPTLDLSADYSDNKAEAFQTSDIRTKGPSGTLQLSVPLYSGGSVNSSVRKAVADYELAQNKLEETKRKVNNDTRKAFLAVMTSLSEMKAAAQSLVSTQSSLEGMKEGYKVGTRTMIDVLDAQKSLYDAQKDFTTSRYHYITNSIALKEAAGILSPEDLTEINRFLGETKVAKSISTKAKITEKPKVQKTSAQAMSPDSTKAEKEPAEKIQPVAAQPKFYLQIGVFKNLDNAKKALGEATGKMIEKTRADNSKIYQVRLEFNTMDDLKAAQDKRKQSGEDAGIIIKN